MARQWFRYRPTPGRRLILIAAALVCLAAFQVHFSLGSFLAGWLELTLGRAFEMSDRRPDGDRPISWREAAEIVHNAAISAGMILVGAGGAFFLAIGLIVPAGREGELLPLGVLVGSVVAARMARWLRGRLWPEDEGWTPSPDAAAPIAPPPTGLWDDDLDVRPGEKPRRPNVAHPHRA